MSRTPSTDLFDLIKTLTKGEKRFFKLFAERHTGAGRNMYVQLFDAIDRQTIYDEQALVERNRSLATVDLRSMKSYLYDLLLRSLRDALRERTDLAKLTYQLEKAAILEYKGLFSQAARQLARIKSTAREHGHHIRHLEILFMESSLKVRQEETNVLERHLELYHEQIAVMAKLRNNLEYYHLFMQTYYLQLATFDPCNAEERGKLDAIMSSPYLGPDAVPATLFGMMNYYEVHARCNQLMSDFEGELHYMEEKLAMFDANPVFRALYLYEYIYASGKALWYYTHFRQYDQFDALLARLKSLRGERLAPHVDLELSIYYAGFLYFVQRCWFQQARELIPGIVTFLEKHRREMESSSIMQFMIAFLILSIKTADFVSARRWLGELFNDRTFHRFIRWIELVKLLNVIVLYELGDDEAFESGIRSFYRFLKKKDKLSDFDGVLLLFLRRLPGIADRLELRRAFENLHAALLDLHETPEGRMRIFQFDIITWLESKIAGRMFGEMLKEKELGGT